MAIQPLTKCKKDGELYKRVPKVDLQLKQVIQLSSAQLVEFTKISDRDNPNFLLEECLVYLINHYWKMNHTDMVNDLSELLIRRSVKRIQNKLRTLSEAEDAYLEVIKSLFTKILDSDGKGDFFQVRYFSALEKLSIDVYRKHRKHTYKTKVFSELENDDFELFEDCIVESVGSSASLSPESIYQNKDLIEQALSDLDEKIQKAFILRNKYGWPVESNDPDKLTISKYMKVTSRTVRNWLKEAEHQLLEWRKENEQAKYKT